MGVENMSSIVPLFQIFLISTSLLEVLTFHSRLKITLWRLPPWVKHCVYQDSWVWTFHLLWDQSGFLGMFSLDLTTQSLTWVKTELDLQEQQLNKICSERTE